MRLRPVLLTLMAVLTVAPVPACTVLYAAVFEGDTVIRKGARFLATRDLFD